jgi:hypothetical protein
MKLQEIRQPSAKQRARLLSFHSDWTICYDYCINNEISQELPSKIFQQIRFDYHKSETDEWFFFSKDDIRRAEKNLNLYCRVGK